jgi:hypothetical protein
MTIRFVDKTTLAMVAELCLRESGGTQALYGAQRHLNSVHLLDDATSWLPRCGKRGFRTGRPPKAKPRSNSISRLVTKPDRHASNGQWWE